MVDLPFPIIPSQGVGQGQAGHDHAAPEWGEILTRTLAHLAAQLTLSQLRLRALATELEAQGVVEPTAVAIRLRALAATEAGVYLRENLGAALVEVIDVDALERELLAYLGDEG